MKRLSAISPLLGAAALVACAACTSTPPAQLEAIRAAGQRLRERHPGKPVGGQGTLAEANAFAATGESEEIDFWRLTSDPTPAELAELRAAFDGAGGRAVQILRPGEAPHAVRPAQMLAVTGDRAGDVLVAGTDRVMRVGPGGHVDWEKRGCGNVHCAYVHGNFVYYSNGAVYRVPRKGGTPWNNPERVWAPENVAGGGVLCFDMTPEGSLVMAVNSTCEVVELDLRSRIELARFSVDARDAEGKLPPPHGRLRCAHKTPSGTFLVACAGAETVREFDRAGQVVWSVKAPAFVFDAVRRPNGNTVVSHVTGLTEYKPDGTACWTLKPEDVSDLHAANFTALQLRPNGNLVVGTWANGAADASHAGAFEVTPEKKVVWSLASSTDVNMMSARRLD